jgi:hypothetical protein
MTGRDLAELAARNLREAILRNSLTTLGVAVGVASLVAMLSLGVGLQTLASDRLTKSGLFDAVFVTSRRGFGGPGGEGPRRKTSAPPEKFKPLDEDARRQFAALPNVVDCPYSFRHLCPPLSNLKTSLPCDRFGVNRGETNLHGGISRAKWRHAAVRNINGDDLDYLYGFQLSIDPTKNNESHWNGHSGERSYGAIH